MARPPRRWSAPQIVGVLTQHRGELGQAPFAQFDVGGPAGVLEGIACRGDGTLCLRDSGVGAVPSTAPVAGVDRLVGRLDVDQFATDQQSLYTSATAGLPACGSIVS